MRFNVLQAFVFLLFFQWKDQNDEKMHHDNHDKVNPLFPKQSEKTEKNWGDALIDFMKQKKDVKRQTEKLKPQIKKNFTRPTTKDGSFFKSAFTFFSGSFPLDTVFILLLIHTCEAHLAASISTVYNHIILISVIAELSFFAAVYKWKQLGVQKELVEIKYKVEEQEQEQVVATLKNLKKELENQKDQLKEQLVQVEAKMEENKTKLQSVEKEITEKEMTFDKPEALLKEKENLLREQWKMDEAKKIYERHLLNIEKLLEPIEIQMAKMKRKDETE